MLTTSKLPHTGTTIFTVMSALAKQHDAINLSQGFPDFSSSERLLQLVNEYMQAGYNQYAPMAGVPPLLEQIADKIHRLYDLAVDASKEITITAGATQALFTAITTFIHPGDEVIIFEPAYDSYRPAVELNGGIVVGHALRAPDYRIDWEAVKRSISSRTRMIIINSPHNPTGMVMDRSDMEALIRITRGTNILVLSDEVYEHIIFDEHEHQSVLRYPELWQRCLATYSFGKTFHNTGWKVGYCVAREELMSEFRKVHQFNVFSVNTPIQHALADFLKDPASYQSLPGFFQQKRDFFLRQMQGSRLRPLACDGTYYCLFDYADISDRPDREFAEWMTREIGVAAIPVSVFYAEKNDDRVIRLCFAKRESTLAAAAERLRSI